eukprot:TRINITY_DN10236_c0_g1_i2.p1 TRINITY_DN10236_c0_g1~~TRINITY_DN10236_c0_g1_i2.p1  ORF type:complete len:175 (-),score=25.13 TRINITY_DN10236_c0_g1_i2:117-641(-)
MRSMVSAFLFSLLNGRIMFVDYTDPVPIHYILEEPGWQWDLSKINFKRSRKSKILQVWDSKEKGDDLIHLKQNQLYSLYREYGVLHYEGYLDFVDDIFNNKFCNERLKKIFKNGFLLRHHLFRYLVNPSMEVRAMMQPYQEFLGRSELSVSIHVRQGDLHLGKKQTNKHIIEVI